MIAGMKFRLHGSSYCSMVEARERMAAREAILRRFHEGQGMVLPEYRAELASLSSWEKRDNYAVEIFEPIIENLSEQNIITRNRYGAEVLNSTELCFVDIDHYPAGLWERVLAFLGGEKRGDEQRLLAELQHLHADMPDLSMRLYRTAGGWRLLLQGEELRPDSPRMLTLFTRLHADPAYVRLCGKQQCWRARLTPKPHRLKESPGHYPRRLAADIPVEGETAWLTCYTAASEGLATCRLIERFGAEMHHPLVALHDERTAALKDGLPLA